MDPGEVVPDRVERDHVGVVLKLFAECIREPRDAAIVHPHGEVRPLDVAGYVLENEVRVLSLRTLQSGIGMSEGGGKGGARKVPALMARLAEKGVDIMGLDVRANTPIRFLTPSGIIADGYDATILPEFARF